MYIRFFALLLSLPSFFSCRMAPENAVALAGGARLAPAFAPAAQSSGPACNAANEIVFRSIDGGATWHDVSAGLTAAEGLRPDFAFHNGQIFVCAEEGLYSGVPHDGALSWQLDMLLGDRVSGLYTGKNYLYVLKYPNGLFRSIPGTEVWESLDKNLSDKTVHSIVETSDGALVVACDSGIYKSTDDGASWKQVFSDKTMWGLRMNAGVLVALGQRGVLRSVDGGDNWDWFRRDNGEYKMAQNLDGRIVVFSKANAEEKLHVDEATGCQPLTSNWTLLFPDDVTAAGCGKSAASKGGSAGCQPAACSGFKPDWAALQAGLSGFGSIYQIERSGAYLFCSHNGGISRSADEGKTWELVFTPTEKNSVLRLNVTGEAMYVVKTIGC